MGLVFLFSKPETTTNEIKDDLKGNLQVMIPKDYVLYPFEASNFDQVEPLLEAYNMVKVYNAEKGGLLAENIKVLRAPKDPSHLAFLIPINIANQFAAIGMSFKLVLQKYTNKEPKLISNQKSKKIKNFRRMVTYGN